jgi:hypothetical protein
MEDNDTFDSGDPENCGTSTMCYDHVAKFTACPI